MVMVMVMQVVLVLGALVEKMTLDCKLQEQG